MTKRISLTKQTHSIINQHLKTSGTAIDATTGNGHDTLFLAQCVGIEGKVFGFDVQQQAIDSTLNRLTDASVSNTVQLFHSSHDKLDSCIPAKYHGKIKVIMFNLGYLPGSDKSIITETSSTLKALNISLNLLCNSGLITIAAYPGHLGGKHESDAIKLWHTQLSSPQYSTKTIYSSDKESAPRLYIITKN